MIFVCMSVTGVGICMQCSSFHTVHTPAELGEGVVRVGDGAEQLLDSVRVALDGCLELCKGVQG